MVVEDEALFKEIDSWFAEVLPFPEPCLRKGRRQPYRAGVWAP